MARVELPITTPAHAGTNIPAQTVGNSSENHFIKENDGLLILEAENADAAATHTVTIRANRSDSGFPVENNVVTLKKSGEAGAKQYIAVGNPSVVNQSNPAGQVFVDVSSNEVKFRVLHPGA
jgi:hypothetical protein